MNSEEFDMKKKSAINFRIVALGAAVALLVIFAGGAGMSLLATEILIMALFASSLNLLMSYGHMVSFGHAAYFGLGAYGFTLAIVRADIPVGLAVFAGPVVATIGGLVFGALCVRLTEIYFAMLTLACGQITFTILFQWYDFTGGDTGVTDFMAPRFGLSEQYYAVFTLAVVILCLMFMWRVIHSPLGLAIRSVGQDRYRAEASGLNPRRIRTTTAIINLLQGEKSAALPGILRCSGKSEQVRTIKIFPQSNC